MIQQQLLNQVVMTHKDQDQLNNLCQVEDNPILWEHLGLDQACLTWVDQWQGHDLEELLVSDHLWEVSVDHQCQFLFLNNNSYHLGKKNIRQRNIEKKDPNNNNSNITSLQVLCNRLSNKTNIP